MRVVWAEPARGDLARIFKFNLARSFEWADRVDTELRERALSLSDTPQRGRPLPRLTARALSLPDIQYVIEYRLDADAVTVLRVRSTREIR